MRYYHLPDASGGTRLVARDGDDAYDLTSATGDLASFRDLAAAAAAEDVGLDAIGRSHVDAADDVPTGALADATLPVAAEEVWAAGVTYSISEEARQAESVMPDVYAEVYRAERPEIFFKATPSRTVGPGEAVGVRADSEWDAPEPELGVVLYEGETVGFTVGNDVSSRDIEGQNPLYLPQAKVYDRCCALGPCVASPGTVEDPHDLEMSVRIERGGRTAFEDATSTGEMVRTCEELVSYLSRHNPLPELTVLLTGTALVPPDEFTMEAGDRVVVDIESVGTLTNPVVEV